MATPGRNAVIVTGAASGMGYQTAKQLFSEGYSVVLADISQEKVDEVAAELAGTNGPGKVLAKATDVSSLAAVEALVKAAVEQFGELYGVAHFAGILGPFGPLHTYDMAAFTQIISVNLIGTANLCQAAIKQFRAQGNPPPSGYSIINTGSFMVDCPVKGCPAYSASKGAVVTLSRCLAKENGTKDVNIRVNCIMPGGIQSGMTKMLTKDFEEELPEWLNAQRRWGKPNEIAAMASFLLSDKASFCTGSEFRVDGGRNI